MSVDFIHLRLHTEFSMIDGLCRIKPLIKSSADQNMPAVAVTDQMNLCGMVKFYKSAIAFGVKPLIGAHLIWSDEQQQRSGSLILLCQNEVGYKNLTKLISQAYVQGPRDKTPMVLREWLTPESCQGLIALSGAMQSDIAEYILKGDQLLAKSAVSHWSNIFENRFYIELQRIGRENEEIYNEQAVAIACEMGVPVVATNDVRFIKASDFSAHEARVCIHNGVTLDDPRREKIYTKEQYLKSPQQMQQLFADLPQALANSVEIAKRCNVELLLGKNFLPNFPIPEAMTVETYLEQVAQQGLEERLHFLFPEQENLAAKRSEYDERLKIELDVINSMGFAGYFLIVADFISWAKQHDIPVGPGRGSGAGSLVAYAMKITDLDPLAYDLLFERFLNPERVSMPDFDIDFCMDQRDDVINYVAENYGRESVSQIITFGTMAAKAVVRDVGRVLGHPYGFVDKIAKLIPFEIGMTLTKALEQEEQLKQRYDEEEDVKGLIDLALKLEGITRNAGKHAGGVVISPSLLTDFTPIYCEEGSSQIVSQFDKDDVEAVGLVKFDFLGLRTLTIIDWAVKTIKQIEGQAPDIERIPLDDKQTFSLLKDCQTTAVFQLESRGMKDLIKRLQPDCFEDIVALVALFRPGPLQSGMVDDFINRKHGRAEVVYPHPDLEPILKPTYGVILYQEQVMQIAQVLAGYSLGAADLLRRAMGKKKPEEMAKQRVIFTEGALKRGVEEKTATYIFDLMEKFAGYGFNKSHSAAYALVSYQTAWLKAHHPAAFMAAVLSSDMDNTDKVVMLIEECRHMGLKVNAPNVNYSSFKFTVNNNEVIYGLGAIKGVGFAAIESIMAAAKEKPFKTLFDFCQRIDGKKCNRRVLEALVRAGALDELGPNRSTIFASLDKAMQGAEQQLRDQALGQGDLFNLGSSDHEGELEYVEQPSWSDEVRLRGEKETLGLYLTGHPIARFRKELKHIISDRLNRVRPEKDKKIIIAGLIVGMRVIKTKSGKKMAILSLDDQSARVDATLFAEAYEENADKLGRDNIIVMIGEASIDDFTGNTRISGKEVMSLSEARERFAKRLVINANEQQMNATWVQDLQNTLAPFKSGDFPVSINYTKANCKARINLGRNWKLCLDDELFRQITERLGEQAVELIY